MRGVLETHFSCSGCGQELEFIYEEDIDKEQWKKVKPSGLYCTKSTDITGGSKVMKRVFVEPCRYCFEPSKRILDAIKTLQEIEND